MPLKNKNKPNYQQPKHLLTAIIPLPMSWCALHSFLCFPLNSDGATWSCAGSAYRRPCPRSRAAWWCGRCVRWARCLWRCWAAASRCRCWCPSPRCRRRRSSWSSGRPSCERRRRWWWIRRRRRRFHHFHLYYYYICLECCRLWCCFLLHGAESVLRKVFNHQGISSTFITFVYSG